MKNEGLNVSRFLPILRHARVEYGPDCRNCEQKTELPFMLVYLRVKNFALVEDISIEPDSGCNVITGETGAGKSILIGALGLVLGLRGDN